MENEVCQKGCNHHDHECRIFGFCDTRHHIEDDRHNDGGHACLHPGQQCLDDHIGFKFNGMTSYKVDSHFPCLRKASIPASVQNAKYELLLAAIDAFKEARKKVPKALLVIVGDGVDKVRLMRQAEKTGLGDDVRFLGRVLPPDLYELYKIGDVFATASEIETQGIVLIEAAACGLPLIAVNKGAVSEVCRDGENGYLCQPGNVTEISEAMVKILSDSGLRIRFSENSIKIASEHDFEKTLDKFENIYRKVVSDKK